MLYWNKSYSIRRFIKNQSYKKLWNWIRIQNKLILKINYYGNNNNNNFENNQIFKKLIKMLAFIWKHV